MAEERVEVQVTAEADELKKGMADARTTNKSATDSIKDDWKQTSKDVEKEAGRMRDSIKKMEDQVLGTAKSLGQNLTMYITAPMVALGALIGKVSIDAVESENLFEVSFKGMSAAARQFSEQMSKDLGVNQYEARKTSAVFNTMFSSMELGTKASFEMSTGLTKLGYDMASFYNLKPEQAFEKLRAGIMGETEPLKQLGINLSDTEVKAYALRTAIIKEGEELSEAGKVVARYNLLMERTKDAQGDLARTIDSPANKLRMMKSRIEENAVSIGMTLMSHIEKLIAMLAGLATQIDAAVKWFSALSSGQQTAVLATAAVVAGIGPLLIAVANLITALRTLTATYAALRGIMITTEAAGVMTASRLAILAAGWVGVAVAIAGAIAALIAWHNEASKDYDVEVVPGTGDVVYTKKQQNYMGDHPDKQRASDDDLYKARIEQAMQDAMSKAAGMVKEGGGGKDSDIVAQFGQELQQIKDSYDAFHEMSKRDEAAFWEAKLSQVAAGSDEEARILHRISTLKREAAREETNARLEALRTELEDARATGADRLAVSARIGEEIKRTYGEESKEYARWKREDVRLAREIADEQLAIEREKLNHARELQEIDLDIEAEGIRLKRELRQISEIEELAALHELENKKYQLKLKSLEDQKKLLEESNKAHTEEYAALLRQIEVLQKQHQLRMAQQTTEMSATLARPYLELADEIEYAMQQSIAGILKGTTSLRQGLRNFFQSIWGVIADYWARDIAATIMGTQAKTAVVAAGAAAQTAVTAAAATASVATTTTTTAANMSMLTAIGTALSSIPWYGWVGLAILAGVAAAQGGGGGESSSDGPAIDLGRNPDSYYQTPTWAAVPTFDVGTWGVPRDMLAMVHEGEPIIPAPFADRARAVLSGELVPAGQAAAVMFNPQISLSATAFDRRGVDKVLEKHGRKLVKVLEAEYRNFTRPKK